MPTVDHEAVVDLGELLCFVALLLVVVVGFATFRRGPDLMEVAPKHDALLKGVLDGTLMIGARLLEHLVEQVGASGNCWGRASVRRRSHTKKQLRLKSSPRDGRRSLFMELRRFKPT
jgi:hypothetical protein